MEENPTPAPSIGKRKSFVLTPEGAVAGEVAMEGAGHVDTGLRIDKIILCDIPHLSKLFPSAGTSNEVITHNTLGRPTRYNKLCKDSDCIIYEHVREESRPPVVKAFLRAGPRATLHFDPTSVNAAIVTCGGLCPGINSVIHHLVTALMSVYGAKHVWGIRGGYAGFYEEDTPPVTLDLKAMEGLQHSAGSILGSSRGSFELEKIMDFLTAKKINQLYIIGGDGTHRGAQKIAMECLRRSLNVAVACVPKTIDNDLDLLDRSFGFMTAVDAAQGAITTAVTEAKCNLPNGIGVVKLMGRSAGFIAAYATLASGDVDLCLIPEAPIVLNGPNGCLPHLEKRVKTKGYAVVVVAEGAGEELLGASSEHDASGNRKLPAIGEYMRAQIEKHFRDQDKTATVKYIDPSYMLRAGVPNTFDQIYCMQLAYIAVHGAMAGLTGFTGGIINNRTVFIPISEITETSPRVMNVRGRTWERVLTITLQPDTIDSVTD